MRNIPVEAIHTARKRRQFVGVNLTIIVAGVCYGLIELFKPLLA